MRPRSFISTSLVFLLGLSLAYSLAIRTGHADVPIAESADLVQPLTVGEDAPRFVVETVEGENFVFDPQNLERPAVLLTFRGGWCPYCNMHLSEVRHVIPEIADLGVDVLFLSGDRPDRLYSSLSHETQEDIANLDYTILSDANAQAAIALGIAFKANDRTINYVKKKGDGYERSSMANHGVLPVPAVYAVDGNGEIRFSYVNADYKVRLSADDLLAVARKIAAD
ncbi:MAG: redoxin domain-containing protein [Gammaproteobacteria bacterium]|nr:redoxin domain-containing protein [Gammaproteobacteria bacterium]